VNEAIDHVLEQREALEKGLAPSFVLSVLAHLLLIGGGFAVTWLKPAEPPIKVVDGMIIALPRGGQGDPAATNPAPAPQAPVQSAAPEPPAPAPVPEPPKVLKPPKEEAPKTALPPPEPTKTRARPTPAPPPRAAGRPPAPEPFDLRPGAGTTRGGTGTSTQTPGLGINLPPGPGVPNGVDSGDWYLAGVQRKIWTIWMRQIKTGYQRDIAVSFTIQADGSLEEGSVRVVQSGGASLLDLAAQRAVFSAQPFGPLPRNYGTNRITIQAVFQPTP
jgi:TonB family protein